MDSNINIYFNGGESDGTAVEPTAPGSTPNPEAPEAPKEKGAKGASFNAKAIGLYIGRQALNTVTSRVGQHTRDSTLQNKVNAGLKMGAYAGAFVANPIMGTLAYGFDLISSTIDYNFKARQESSTLSVLNERAGNINRSR